MKIAVLGPGGWGSSLASIASTNVEQVVMWGRKEKVVDEINNNHTNKSYGEFKFKDNVTATTEMSVALKGADIVVVAVPSIAVVDTVKAAEEFVGENTIWVNTAKGFEPETKKLITNTIKQLVKSKKVLSLMGPTHAEEVSIGLWTSICVIGKEELDKEMIQVQNVFNTPYFRVYLQHDEISSLFAAALKNVYAVCSGIISGMNQGDNARAALISRATVEMARLTTKIGGNLETFIGLTGIGDLVVTATSKHSRNFRFGLSLAKTNSIEKTLKEVDYTAEGYYATKIAYEIANEEQVRMPILDLMYKVLYENIEPKKGMDMLISSKPGLETPQNT